MRYLGLRAFNERGNVFVSDRPVSYTHLDVYKRQVTIGYGMKYLGLTAFNELDNGFVNDMQVDIAVMGISLRSAMACSTIV